MRDPHQFDRFYSGTRVRLLLQTYALTGDLAAARSAVKDAFTSAWHHWHKVSRQDDPEAWVRPYAWHHAQLKHRTHFWHRDRSLSPDHRATFDALSQLPPVQRRALLLHALAGLPTARLATELELAPAHADRQLRLAIAAFAIHRDVPPQEVAAPLLRLAERTDGISLPRVTAIRRAGTARRRLHTTAGVAAAAVTLAVSGLVVGTDAGVAPTLDGARGLMSGEGGTGDGPVIPLATDDLLASSALTGLSKKPFTETATGDNTDGTGINLPCQTARFADPEAIAALVRTHRAGDRTKTTLTQVVERSATPAAAAGGLDSVLGWFTNCGGRRMQLLSAQSVAGVGDEGAVLLLRDWADPGATYTVGVARTGAIVTTLGRTVADRTTPKVSPFVRTMTLAMRELCDAPGGGTCPTTAKAVTAPPPAGREARGLLQEVDLPPVAGAAAPWVGTAAKPATSNPAATTCDKSSFRGKAIAWSATRTFLIPQATKLPTRFGLSETVGRFRTEKSAQTFVADAAARMNGCEKRDLAASVTHLSGRKSAHESLTTWKLTARVGQDSEIVYYMALVRRGGIVAQVGFVPASANDISPATFNALAERALARLANLPR